MDDSERDELVSAIESLREDLRDYRDTTEQYELDKRVENIQVLIALGVIGGTLTVLTSRLMNTPFWDNLLDSPYWITILIIFVGANGLFLILKLLTIPLQQVTKNRYLIYTHDVIEPFLYFFAVSGVLLALIVRLAIDPIFSDFQASIKSGIALAALILPFFAGVAYAQAYRFNAALRRSRDFITEINQLLVLSVNQGTISSEERSSILRDILVSSTPTPFLAYAFFLLWREIRDQLNSEKSAEESRNELDEYIDDYLTNPTIRPITYSLIIQLFRYLSATEDTKKDVPDQKRANLRIEIQDLRNKAVHGELDEEDLERFNEYLERFSEMEKGEDESPAKGRG